MKSYHASGKILLCGEYAVLAGVKALCFPVKVGQSLKVDERACGDGNWQIDWKSREADGTVWFEGNLNAQMLKTESSEDEVLRNLIKGFNFIHQNNPNLLDGRRNFSFETHCEFNRSWGLGSSSSLVSLLSQWSGVDAFDLQRHVFGGSGYDVAVAGSGKPLIYWLENDAPNWETWSLNPEFTSDWHLVFTGKKQNSRVSLTNSAKQIEALKQDTFLKKQLESIVNGLQNPQNKTMLEAGLELWQAILSMTLGLPRAYDDLQIQPVKGGLCKWLGAWGGDVLLVNDEMLKNYAIKFDKMEIKSWNEFVVNR